MIGNSNVCTLPTHEGQIPLTEEQVRTRRMLTTYTADQEGMDIRTEDTIRAANGKWFTPFELSHFRDKSSDHCPTYGSCPHCFKAGPVGQQCIDCKNDKTIYLVLCAGMEADGGRNIILDSENVARVFRKTTEIAKADRQYRWLQTPILHLRRDIVHNMLKKVARQEILEGIDEAIVVKLIGSQWD